MSAVSVVIVGAGGHAKVVIEALRAMGGFEIVGLTDPAAANQSLLGVAVIGDDAILPDLRARGVTAAVVALGENGLRQKLGVRVRELGFALPPVIHPQALVSPSAHVQAGAVVMARAVVGTESIVGELAIINTGAIIDHNNFIGGAVHIAPGCALAGCVRVGARSLIGIGSAIRPDITIGKDVIVGAGSAVVSDVPDHARVGGVPARILPQRSGIAG